MSDSRLAIFAVVLAALYILFGFGLTSTGMLGPDEPRYASIGREMARSGDWITPRLWGEPWFEKPPLLYWMTALGFRLGLDENLAPRLPVALTSVGFLFFFCWCLRGQFGLRAALYSTVILGTSAGWLAFSYVGATDLPMSATFSAAMLLAIRCSTEGRKLCLIVAGALLGLAVLAKGLVPLVLAAPLVCLSWMRCRGIVRFGAFVAFLAVAVPWYLICFQRNGMVFIKTFFWEHHFGRFASEALQHVQPAWFYLPVLAAGLFPFTPALILLFRRSLCSDRRRVLLLWWLVWGMVFFSASTNKLPGYILPLLPPAAALMGVSLAEARHARWILAAVAAMLAGVGPLGKLLPQALASGLSRSALPAFQFWWLLPIALTALVWWLEKSARRDAAVFAIAAGFAVCVLAFKWSVLPELDRVASARPTWVRVRDQRDQVCLEDIHRNWRYGLNYYSAVPLPACLDTPRPIHVTEDSDEALLVTGGSQ